MVSITFRQRCGMVMCEAEVLPKGYIAIDTGATPTQYIVLNKEKGNCGQACSMSSAKTIARQMGLM